MVFHPSSFGPPPRIILESVDLLLARLGQLGYYVRDTVARIVGSSVADAVSEALRLIVHRLPGRRPTVVPTDPWSVDTDPYDPYAADEFLAAPSYPTGRYAAAPTSDWRQLLRWLAANVLDVSQCLWQWSVLRRSRIAWAVAIGLVALFLTRSQSDSTLS